MQLQLSHLRTLEAVARRGSFSRAAHELHITQPAVSMQVRALESALGAPLLERVGKRALPTPAGELLLVHAARARRELETAVEQIQGLKGIVAGRIRIGTSASISTYLLPPALSAFRRAYPRTDLVIETGNAAEIARSVVESRLDVGIVSLPVRDRELRVAPFHDDELVAIAPPDDPRVARARVGAAELAREPLVLFDHGGNVRRVIDGWFHAAGVAPVAPMELSNTEAIKKLVEAGLGLSVTSWFAVRAEVEAGRLRAVPLEPPLLRRIGVVLRRGRPVGGPLAAFLAELERLRVELDRGRRAPRGRPAAARRPRSAREALSYPLASPSAAARRPRSAREALSYPLASPSAAARRPRSARDALSYPLASPSAAARQAIPADGRARPRAGTAASRRR
jgi:DNA-binding transcriptional LysR family regulator